MAGFLGLDVHGGFSWATRRSIAGLAFSLSRKRREEAIYLAGLKNS